MNDRHAHHLRPPLFRNIRQDKMLIRLILIAASAFAFAGSLPRRRRGEGAVPNLAGAYRCELAPEHADWATSLRSLNRCSPGPRRETPRRSGDRGTDRNDEIGGLGGLRWVNWRLNNFHGEILRLCVHEVIRLQ
jgi:hypothetical protein